MKRLFALILSLVAVLPLSAEVVGREEARNAAVEALAKIRPVSQARLSLAMEGYGSARFACFQQLDFVKRANSVAAPDPTYYVFNNPDGGWVIIAGDDSVSPVLAYSREGSFEAQGLPQNLQWWLDMLDAQVLECRDRGAARNPEWDNVSVTANPVLELETALWDQTDPYNRESPSYNGARSYTGCVATAAAILCRYHQWPPYGKGKLSAYRTSTHRISIPENVLGRTYDYSLMPLVYKRGSFSNEQGAAVAALMYDLGVGARMDFTPNGSGAYTDDLLDALVNNFSYKKTAVLKYKSSYSESRWIELLKSELDNNGPVIYGGVTKNNEGHQFIFDGYDDQNFFHVNWGWSGAENGYFKVSQLGNNSTGIFANYQDAILNLEPDYNGFELTPEDIARITSLSYDKETAVISFSCATEKTLSFSLESQGGEQIEQGSVAKGSEVKLDFSSLADGSYILSIWEKEPYKLTIKL